MHIYSVLNNSALYIKEVTKVNKAELITKMSEKSKLTKKDAELALKALIESVEEALENKGKGSINWIWYF